MVDLHMAGCRVASARALAFLGAACVLCGLVAYGSYWHVPASIRAPALALYVPPAGFQPTPLTGPVAPPSVMAPMRSPESRMSAASAEPVAVPSVVIPMPVDYPGTQLHMGPVEKQALRGSLQMLLWGLAASSAIGMTIAGKGMYDRLQNSGDFLDRASGGRRPPMTTVLSGGVDTVAASLGRAGRAGVPTMMGDDPDTAVIDISSQEEFDMALDEAGSSLVVVDYSTSWCGPCKIIAPKFDEFSKQYKNVVFLKVMGDSSPTADKLMRGQGVRALPSFHFWKGKKKIDNINGAKAQALQDMIEQNM